MGGQSPKRAKKVNPKVVGRGKGKKDIVKWNLGTKQREYVMPRVTIEKRQSPSDYKERKTCDCNFLHQLKCIEN